MLCPVQLFICNLIKYCSVRVYVEWDSGSGVFYILPFVLPALNCSAGGCAALVEFLSTRLSL